MWVGLGVASGECSDAQLVGDGHYHFEDGHESGYLAEVAAADDLCVHLEAVLVVMRRHTAADLVQAAEDARRQLRRRKRRRWKVFIMLTTSLLGAATRPCLYEKY